ncbi:MAG: 3-phosphoshikimate 1-carboxyvinyltransferase, partial [Candidatus Peregrinibacteria bacterium]|nr:3-phosphoshikimate 1-carboxyvinyltransferase [Candidatus Peregrinibacteria bacterium]
MKKINIPGSKSISNRVLFLAALADKKMDLVGVLESDDTRYLRECLGNFGVEFEKRGDVITVIPPEELSNEGRDKENFIGNAGTAARFLTAFSLFFKGEYVLKGIPRMHERPFEDLFMALKDLGVGIESEKEGFLPATFMGKERLDKNKVSISGKISSQFISGLLLVSPRVVGGLEIDIIDEIPSRPYVEMTVDILRIWGVEVEVSEDFKNFKVQEGITAPDSFHVPADCSSASYPVAFSLLKKEEVEISNFGEKTFQGDEKFLEVAEKMGAKIEKNGDKVQIFPPQKLKALGEISFEEMPDVSMTGMILAAFADGESEFH